MGDVDLVASEYRVQDGCIHVEQLFDQAEVIVVASADQEFGALLRQLEPPRAIIDLVGVWNTSEEDCGDAAESYDGIAW